MKNKSLNKKMALLTAAICMSYAPLNATQFIEIDEPTTAASSLGNISHTSIGGNLGLHIETETVHNKTINQGGSASIHINSPKDPFEEGRRLFNMTPPDYKNAETYFLMAAGAQDQHIKVQSLLHCAKCVLNSDPSEAISYYEKVLEIENNDNAYRGLLELDHNFANEVQSDTIYCSQILERALQNGNKIKRQTKEDRLLLTDITSKLAAINRNEEKQTEAVIPEMTPITEIAAETKAEEHNETHLAEDVYDEILTALNTRTNLPDDLKQQVFQRFDTVLEAPENSEEKDLIEKGLTILLKWNQVGNKELEKMIAADYPLKEMLVLLAENKIVDLKDQRRIPAGLKDSEVIHVRRIRPSLLDAAPFILKLYKISRPQA